MATYEKDQNKRMRKWFKDRTGLKSNLLIAHMREIDKLLNKKASKTEKKALNKIGQVWWDLDRDNNVCIECEKPLTGKHYLLKIQTSHNDKGYTTARTIAEFIVRKINNVHN